MIKLMRPLSPDLISIQACRDVRADRADRAFITKVSYYASLLMIPKALCQQPLACLDQIGPTCLVREGVGIEFQVYSAETVT